MVLAQLNIHKQKNEVGPIPHIIYKLKINHNINVRAETLKLRENIQVNLHGFHIWQGIISYDTKNISHKRKDR